MKHDKDKRISKKFPLVLFITEQQTIFAQQSVLINYKQRPEQTL
jgi:hypothetical protein